MTFGNVPLNSVFSYKHPSTGEKIRAFKTSNMTAVSLKDGGFLVFEKTAKVTIEKKK